MHRGRSRSNCLGPPQAGGVHCGYAACRVQWKLALGNNADVVLVEETGPLPVRLASLLASFDDSSDEFSLALDELSLRLGLRLPDQAQTLTYWQRGDLGRALRGAGFMLRVQYGRIVFVRYAAQRGRQGPTFAGPIGEPDGLAPGPGDHGRW